MISTDCDFETFVREARGMDCYEVIYLAEKEAIQAWRHSYHNESRTCSGEASRQYQEKLIGLIRFMRHGLKPGVFNDQEFDLCSRLRNESVQPSASAAPDGPPNLA
ncbi:MAG: hypothetical protein AMJ54_04240 [Deltaproteobacteria bacterium SG8_13]|nr:MAG: hypothetical protein AMJ54_04240 [Deltaproteobacteria bacterium SG8_13]